jgi:hypothetical protein
VRLAALVAALLVAWPVAAARADGDPASDVLIKSRVFYPYQLKLPRSSTASLEKTIASARDKGYSVRVAMIAHDFDLGTAGLLFRQPQTYAKFLAQELAQFNSDWVLIVMPNGYGIYNCVGVRRAEGYVDPCEKEEPSRADQRALAGVPKVAGDDYAAAAEAAVRRLAALHGVSFGSRLPLIAGGVVAVLLAGLGVFAVRRKKRRDDLGEQVGDAGADGDVVGAVEGAEFEADGVDRVRDG